MKKKLEVKKIQNKKEIEVVVQKNCTIVGKPVVYIKGQDCLHDCYEMNRPHYYGSPNV